MLETGHPISKPQQPAEDKTAPKISGRVTSEAALRPDPLVQDADKADDSEVMIVEGGEDTGDRYWPSEGAHTIPIEDTHKTITYKLPPNVLQHACLAWSDVEYESHDEHDDFAAPVKLESQPTRPTPKAKSGYKDEPTYTGRPKQASQQPSTNQSTPVRSTRKQGKVKGESASEENNNDDQHGNNDEGSEDSCAEYEEGVKLPEGVVMLHFEVPCFKGIRIMKLCSDSTYRMFCRSTVDILDCSVSDLNIGYSAGKPMELKGKLTPQVIENKEDYDDMVTDAVRVIEAERTRYRKEKDTLAKAAGKSKGKAGAPSKKQPAPIQPYVIKLVLMDEDDPKDKKSGKKKGGKSKGTGNSGGHCDGEESLASRQLTWFERLQVKHFCPTHQRVCAVIPGLPNEAGTHVKLERASLLIWAEMLAKNNPEASINCPPKALNLQSRVPEEVEEQKSAAMGSGLASETKLGAPQPLAQAAATQAMMPWLYGHPGMFYPPFIGTGAYNGYPGQQMLQFVGSAPPPATAQALPPPDPLLSEWLRLCDSGHRGVDNHKFQSYLPAFDASMMTHLSDIACFDSAKHLIEAIAEYQPKMPFGRASRLIEYVKADYR